MTKTTTTNLKGDIFGGITAGIVALPLSLAFGIQAFGVIDAQDVPNIPQADAVVLLTVLFLTVFVDLLIAVGIGMIIACVLFMKRASDLVESGYNAGEMSFPPLCRRNTPSRPLRIALTILEERW